MEPALQINNLCVKYGKSTDNAVKDLSFSVKKGSIVGFLGPNGAGKTSTIKSILGIIAPYKGTISIFGDPLSKRTKELIGYMPEIANYYNYLTPKELLYFYGKLFNINRTVLRIRIKQLLTNAGLLSKRNDLLKTFSKGMLQKVSFAQALINDPDLLILDEPTTGLDPIARMQMRDTLIELKNNGKTILFSSHELSEVELICDNIIILKSGQLVTQNSPANLVNKKGEHVSVEKYFFEMIKAS
ncbi:MAG: ABC transporter ATP-binding protein [Candidatus Omnitrophica bacterium]|nr:ABC transporter ATP-binding protein [Candidatus Omnitrophota bacterium]